MSLKTVIAGIAAVALAAGTAFMPTAASAQRGHGAPGFHPGPGGHPGFVHPGGGFHPGFAYRGYRGYRGWGGWAGVAPWWGYGFPYYYGPSCGYVRVVYYRHHRAYWHLVYECY